MDGSEFSLSAISSRKLKESTDKAEVTVFKKQLDSQGDLTKKLIEDATDKPLPPGIGSKVNTVA